MLISVLLFIAAIYFLLIIISSVFNCFEFENIIFGLVLVTLIMIILLYNIY
jgi:hypothetical protein